jgi:hypothetical protein
MVIVLQVSREDNKYWYKELEGILHLHRDNDMPAVIYNDGQKQWFADNKLIRNELPWQTWEDD